jgi:hypothetical protein
VGLHVRRRQAPRQLDQRPQVLQLPAPPRSDWLPCDDHLQRRELLRPAQRRVPLRMDCRLRLQERQLLALERWARG